MPTDPEPLNLGDGANTAPCVDPAPVACAPDPGVVEGVDQDCDGEDDRADGDEPDTDEEFVKVMRDIEEIDEDGDLVRAWSWTGDPLLSSYGRAAAAKKAAERYYGQSLLWWEERPGYWMAARPFIRMPDSLRSEPDDNDCDSADPDGDGLADSEGVDYRADDCDDTTPCWCGETDPLYDDEGLDATCDGSGTLICHCGGDLCVCHHHGETECPGCEHCAELEGDDDGPFEDGDELDGESGEACCRCGATVDVGRYRGRWICDDCDDNEED